MLSISEHSLTLSQFGLTVEMAGDSLKVTPSRNITPEARQYIADHKAALLEQLQQTTTFQPVGNLTATVATAMALKQPVSPPHKPVGQPIEAFEIRDCLGCRHFGRPGRSSGGCVVRQDFPPMYGANHPLRRIPPEALSGCGQWSSPG